MLSNFISEDTQKSSVSDLESVVSVLISNYPLSNGGYLVTFSKEGSDGSYKPYDPSCSLDFETSKITKFLEFSSVFLPKGCFYLPEMELACFIKALSSGTSAFEIKLVPATSQMQGLIMVQVDEKSLFDYGPKEED